MDKLVGGASVGVGVGVLVGGVGVGVLVGGVGVGVGVIENTVFALSISRLDNRNIDNIKYLKPFNICA
jgi:hypothetical protein